MKTKDNASHLLKDWLEKLQQESWQLELLISGFAIFGLFGLKGYLFRQMVLATSNLGSGSDQILSLLPFIIIAGLFSTFIFIVNLLIHILVRGLWIGAIGLRYVSQDIEYENLKFSNRFIHFYKRTIGSFDEYIIKLERFASIIFSFTFLLFFAFISFFLISMEILLFQVLIRKIGASIWFIDTLSTILFGIVSLPNIKVKGNLFEVFVKFNSNTDKFIKHLDSTLVETNTTGFKTSFLSGRKVTSIYTKNEKRKMLNYKLDSIKNLTPKFMKDNLARMKDSLEKSIISLDQIKYENNLISIKKAIKKSIIFSIDGNVIANEDFSCDFYVHPNANEKGMLCFFPIDLNVGRHMLKYQKITYSEKFERIDTSEVEIPFIYQGD